MIKNIIIVMLLALFSGSDYFNAFNLTAAYLPKPPLPAQTDSDTLTICSFNIMWLGCYKKKDNEALASILKNYDIVVIQEVIFPPKDGIYPDETTYSCDPDVKDFFDAMENTGFTYVLSSEETGPCDEIHEIGSSTEWWVCFYKENKVNVADDLPNGFLDSDRSANPNYARVPYAFAFRKDELDMVLISVHSSSGDDTKNTRIRALELQSIFNWINTHNSTEKDFIVVGDMGIENQEELNNITPSGYLSLNDECRKTNTDPDSDKPYDHVLYNTRYTTNEINIEYDMEVIDLTEAMRDKWEGDGPYPGDPYDYNLFPQYYSDHHPIVFQMIIPSEDDD